jgi:predicted RNase H-like HicB family nuclease
VEAALSGYAVIVEVGDNGGYGAWSPDLPGCVAVGDSYDECVRWMREAIPLHIDSLRTHGDPIPRPSGPSRSTLREPISNEVSTCHLLSPSMNRLLAVT